MRLIDADKADVNFINTYYSDHCRTDDVQEWLDEQPTIDAEPVKHGEWVSSRFNATYGEYEEQCSCCKGWSLEYDKPYCPNCGAKMDGGKET